MSYRKFFWFNNHNKSISFEVSRNLHFGFSISADGGDRKVKFHWWFLFSFWLSFRNFLPEKWFPKEYNSYAKKWLHSAERELSLCIHGGQLWWNVWTSPMEWSSKTPKWRRGNFNFRQFILGKTNYSTKELEYKDFILPYYEGNYKIRVIKSNAKWTMRRRLFWFLDISTDRYEVKAGYIKDGEWKDVPIPHEGKGENSWDCDEDATYSISFGIKNKLLRNCTDVALEFWKSTMKDRIRYGGTTWLPQKFKDKKIEVIEA